MKQLKALLINPYIYDFAAYSFWSSPLGLLYIGSILRKNHIDVSFIDCLRVNEKKRRADGRGPFIKEVVEKPEAIKGIKKKFRRYGISKEMLIDELIGIDQPDIILITSIMTYWYLGAKEVLEVVKGLFPASKIVIGGIYPTLCYEHATYVMKDADIIIKHGDLKIFYSFLEDLFSIDMPFKPDPYDFERLPYPAYDLYEKISFIPLLTSYGCIYRCPYCATPYMHPNIFRRDIGGVISEIEYWQDYGVENYVIYDDNFLSQKDKYASLLLKKIIELPFAVKIFNPNALNASLIDENIAHLLFNSGFKEVRLGLETIHPEKQKALGGKINNPLFERAVNFLFKAGFKPKDVSAYILAGLPFQKKDEVKDAIDYVSGIGVITHLAEYTPIPHTELFQRFKGYARYPIEEDPIFQNNALFPFAWECFTEEDLNALKLYCREKNEKIKEAP
ncbi:MAG: radical SAM protein [Syntrophorhabdaceae bacterium]|nr:radical SAM protein [Syntrophorhabdaceae bacterium]